MSWPFKRTHAHKQLLFCRLFWQLCTCSAPAGSVAAIHAGAAIHCWPNPQVWSAAGLVCKLFGEEAVEWVGGANIGSAMWEEGRMWSCAYACSCLSVCVLSSEFNFACKNLCARVLDVLTWSCRLLECKHFTCRLCVCDQTYVVFLAFIPGRMGKISTWCSWLPGPSPFLL